MEIRARDINRELLLEFSGEMDHHGARNALKEVEMAIDAALPQTLILDFSGDIYGDGMTLDVIGYIRGIHKFESMAALHAQIQRDAQTARTMLEETQRI